MLYHIPVTAYTVINLTVSEPLFYLAFWYKRITVHKIFSDIHNFLEHRYYSKVLSYRCWFCWKHCFVYNISKVCSVVIQLGHWLISPDLPSFRSGICWKHFKFIFIYLKGRGNRRMRERSCTHRFTPTNIYSSWDWWPWAPSVSPVGVAGASATGKLGQKWRCQDLKQHCCLGCGHPNWQVNPLHHGTQLIC